MKVIEILNFNRELLKRLQAAGIRLEDARYIDLYADYTRLLDHGEKVSYAVAVLSEKYSVSERKVYTLVKRFQSDCKILDKILATGKTQTNKKGNIQYLLNEQLSLTPADLLDIFEGHNIARKKLRSELQLFMQGERNVEKYREAGINWWDYCGSILVNSYPTYFEKLPPLMAKINREKRNSKNYVLFLGETGAESNQAPCLSLVQFQLDDGELVLSAYQRSSDANLGLPSDIYHLYLMARQIELPLKSITLFLGNVHIYENNIPGTRALLAGDETVRFGLNV